MKKFSTLTDKQQLQDLISREFIKNNSPFLIKKW
jgi:hypothetical protein